VSDGPDDGPDGGSALELAGQLLIATPVLRDPNFARTVVFLADHNDEGALGVVLNRPSETPVTDVLPLWEPVATSPTSVFVGGPVAQDGALGLARLGASGQPEDGFQPLAAGFGAVDLDGDPALLAPYFAGLRIFAGYAGWGPGQLESEIEEGAWYVVSAAPDDVFSPRPALLWQHVLRRQGGDLALVSTFPLDPTLN
jgi:putative transcriptional regulator